MSQFGNGKIKRYRMTKQLVIDDTSADSGYAGDVSAHESPSIIGLSRSQPLVGFTRFGLPTHLEMVDDSLPKQIPFHLRYIGGVSPLNHPPSYVEDQGALVHGRLLNDSIHLSPSLKRSETWSGTQRSVSQRQIPLVDLTPTFREAPQWDPKKKGHGVRAVNGMPLIELATGPYAQNSVVSGMPSTVLRRG